MFYVKNINKGTLKILPNKATASIKELANFPIKENHLYMRNWAVSAFEDWGLNGNADGFLREELQKAYKTFEGSWVCLDHKADSEEDSIGTNIKAIYHPENFVELIKEIDIDRAEKKRPGLVEKLKNKEITDTSMGSLAAFSVCTVCGNVAFEEEDRCDHLKYHKGEIVEYNGEQYIAGELYFEVVFIEDSIITHGEGADINAKVFEVAARKSGSFNSFSRDELWYAIKEIRASLGNNSLLKALEKRLEYYSKQD